MRCRSWQKIQRLRIAGIKLAAQLTVKQTVRSNKWLQKNTWNKFDGPRDTILVNLYDSNCDVNPVVKDICTQLHWDMLSPLQSTLCRFPSSNCHAGPAQEIPCRRTPKSSPAAVQWHLQCHNEPCRGEDEGHEVIQGVKLHQLRLDWYRHPGPHRLCCYQTAWNALAKSWAPLREIRLKLSRSWRNVKECCCAIDFVHAWMSWSPKLQCLDVQGKFDQLQTRKTFCQHAAQSWTTVISKANTQVP